MQIEVQTFIFGPVESKTIAYFNRFEPSYATAIHRVKAFRGISGQQAGLF
jgi:hypothetical protein